MKQQFFNTFATQMAQFTAKRSYISQHTRRGKVQRDMRLDNVRGFLIILVVIGHFLLPVNSSETRLILGITYAIYTFHMPCFVMLSGYYAKSIYKDGRFRWGKIVQMLWLYIVYETVVYFTEGLADGIIPPFPHYLWESGAPWYLLALSIWYMTIPFFQRFRGKRSSIYISIGMFVAVSFLKYVIQLDCLLCMDRVLTFLPFFYTGFFCSQVHLDRYILSRYKRPVDIVALFCTLLILFGTKDLFFKFNLVVYGADYRRYASDYTQWLWLINMIWYAVAMCMSLFLIGNMLNRRMMILSKLGMNTLSIYFVHRPVRDILQAGGFYDLIDPFNRVHVFLLILFSILLTILLSNGLISGLFNRLRQVFDGLLEKHYAL